MRVVQTIFHTILVSFGGAIAGGAVAGAVLMLVTAFPETWEARPMANILGAIGITLMATMVMAALGPVGGLMFGLVPTFLLGTLLSLVRRWRPFDHMIVWAIAGGSTGLAIPLLSGWGMPSAAPAMQNPSAWLAGWAAGGCTAMLVFWAWGPGRSDPGKAAAAMTNPPESKGVGS
jgi:hypothetical protein